MEAFRTSASKGGGEEGGRLGKLRKDTVFRYGQFVARRVTISTYRQEPGTGLIGTFTTVAEVRQKWLFPREFPRAYTVRGVEFSAATFALLWLLGRQ